MNSALLWTRICAVTVFLIGLSVFFGWVFDISILKSMLPGFVEMKTNTSIAYMSAGIALWFVTFPDQKNALRISRFISSFLFLLGGATACQYFFNIDLGIDQLVFKENAGALGTTHPNRMALTSALNFFFKGLALLLIDTETKRGHRPSQYLTLISAVPAIQALIAYVYGVQNMFGSEITHHFFTQMAIHAAIAFIVLSIGTLLARPRDGLLRPFVSKQGTGKLWLKVLLIAVFFPPILGILVSFGAKIGFYDPRFGFSVLAMGCLMFLSCAIWFAANKTVQVEQARNKLLEELKQAVSVRDDFLSIASHELKTPLTSLILQTQMGLRELDKSDSETISTKKLRSILESDQLQMRRLNRLIEDMLDISRINSGKYSFESHNFDLYQLIEDVVGKYHLSLAASGTEIIIHSTIRPFMVQWDSFRIEQVITNLLTNAIKYAPNGLVDIHLSFVGPGQVRFSFNDHGVGIAKEDHERIFERFERAIKASETSGLGLGLYIVRHIIQMHGGLIHVESEIGKGTNFIMDLPQIVLNTSQS